MTGRVCKQQGSQGKAPRSRRRVCSGACPPLGAAGLAPPRPRRVRGHRMAKYRLRVRLPRAGPMAPAERCGLCRQTFFCGRGHVYSRKHQRQLKVALERLLPQVRTGGRSGLRAAWERGCGHCGEGPRGWDLGVPLRVLLGLCPVTPSPPQVEAARKAVRAAQVERYVPEHERCCWCLCCSCEVRKHLSHGNLTVLHGGLLEHLAR